jgi:PAS domain S-box-containing protein
MAEPAEGGTVWPAEELEAALGGAGVGVWSFDPASGVVRWSAEAERIFGVAAGGFAGTFDAYLAAIHPEDSGLVVDRIEAARARAIAGREPTAFDVEHRIVRPDGPAWVECRGRVLLDDDGRICQMLGTVVDVSARKRTEEVLSESASQYRLFTELASDYVYVADLATMAPVIVAGSFERTTGMSWAEVEARGGWLEVVHPDDRSLLSNGVGELAAGRTVVNEYRIVDSAGAIRWLRDTVRPILDPAGQLLRFMGGVQDVTERRRLADELLHASKLDAVARLAGGVAHDFNNLLSVMYAARCPPISRRCSGPSRTWRTSPSAPPS